MTALVQWLRTQKELRGILAQLRCGIVSGKQQRAWPLLARFDGIEGHKGEVIRTIAALYAAHPDESTVNTMGVLCRLLRGDQEIRDDAQKESQHFGPIGMRFQHLLAAETAEVCPRVVRLILRAKVQGIPVNYMQLQEDLLQWEMPQKRRYVQERWAQQFWAPAVQPVESDDAPGQQAEISQDTPETMP